MPGRDWDSYDKFHTLPKIPNRQNRKICSSLVHPMPIDQIGLSPRTVKSLEIHSVMQHRKNQPNKRASLPWLLVGLIFHPFGCVTLQKVSSRQPSQQARFVSQTDESCPLPDRRKLISQIAAKMNPARMIPERSYVWMWEQQARWSSAKQSCSDWIARKKEEANPPPWPRFHPIPTKPVFEPEEQSPNDAPEAFGTFGKPS
jgi:hypothetical protein